MQKYINNVAVKNGARVLTPLVGGLVTVTAIDGSPVDIFDANGGLPRTSDLLTDINGAFSFYAADGRYTITITGAGIVPITITDVLLEDPVDGVAIVGDGTVVTSKLADNAVTTPKIIDSAVTAGKLASDAVTTVKIVDAAVTAGKLGDSAVTTVKLNASAVTTAKLADEAVTDAKVAAGAGINASKISFTQSGAGALPQSLLALLYQAQFVSASQYKGIGVTDQEAAEAALAAHLLVHFGGPSDTWSLTAPLMTRIGHKIRGNGAVLTQATLDTEIFNTEGKSDVTISDLTLSLPGGYLGSDSARGAGVYGGVSGARIHVTRCKILNAGYAGARFKAQTDCSFTYNTVIGPGNPTLTAVSSGQNYGVLFDTGCDGALIHGNSISKHAQGVILAGVSNCRITANHLFAIKGQHGIYAGAWLRNVVIASNTIEDCDLIGIKVQAQDYTGLDNENISITGNSVYNCRDQGILLSNAITASVQKCRNITVTGNSVKLTGGSGININSTIGAIVSGNTIDLAAFSGINWSESSWLTIHNNVITRSGLSAMRDDIACSNISVTLNRAIDCCTSLTPGSDNHGLFISNGSEYTIRGNQFHDANAKMRYGIYIVAGTMATFSVDDNLVAQSTDTGLRLGDTSAMRSYTGNVFNGTLAATFNDPVAPSVAATGTLTLPANHDVVRLTGSTPVTFINTNGHSGRTVTLYLEVGSDVRTGIGNLYLGTNCVGTAKGVLTISCDGSEWRQVARSPN